MRLWLLLLAMFLVLGCSRFASEDGMLIEGAKGYAACVSGHGPPLTGEGHYARGKVDSDFKGTIIVAPDCGIVIKSE